MADSPLSILVTEDDAMIRVGLVLTLEGMGYEVIEAGSGAETMAALDKGKKIDVLVADLGLPDMNGLELATKVRADRPDLQIIIATGQTALPEGADKVPGPKLNLLVKPFSADQLANSIKRTVAGP